MKIQCNLCSLSKWLLEKRENVKDMLLIIQLIINMLRCYNVKKRLATHLSNNDDICGRFGEIRVKISLTFVLSKMH